MYNGYKRFSFILAREDGIGTVRPADYTFSASGFLSAYRIADFAEKRNCHNFIKVGKVLRHLIKYGENT